MVPRWHALNPACATWNLIISIVFVIQNLLAIHGLSKKFSSTLFSMAFMLKERREVCWEGKKNVISFPIPHKETWGRWSPVDFSSPIISLCFSSSTAHFTWGHSLPKHHTLNGVPEAVSISSVLTNRLWYFFPKQIRALLSTSSSHRKEGEKKGWGLIWWKRVFIPAAIPSLLPHTCLSQGHGNLT